MPSNLRNKSLERAKFAYDQVKAAVTSFGTDDEKKKKFKSHIKEVPTMVKTNGLAAAFAFIYSKSDKPDYNKIGDITKEWLTTQTKILPSQGELDEIFVNINDTVIYRRCSKEILALYTWLKRYADGLIKD